MENVDIYSQWSKELNESLGGVKSKRDSSQEKLEKQYNGIYVFVSFDLVGSTAFKAKRPNEWKSLISKFYNKANEMLKKEFQENTSEPVIWKYIGDEVLFYVQIWKSKDLYCSVKHVFTVKNALIKDLIREENFHPHLSIKAAVWVAKCSVNNMSFKQSHESSEGNLLSRYTDSPQNSHQNIITIDSKNDNKRIVDFLGIDIDKGFRMSKYTERNKVAVSAKLALVLYKYLKLDRSSNEHHCFMESAYKIVSYEKMKGVWGERHYPIVWYDENWGKFKENLEYDEVLTSEIVKKVVKDEIYKINNISDLVNVYDNINGVEDIENICNELKHLDEVKTEYTKSASYNPPEVHCSALCYSGEKILLLKRPESKEHSPGHYEFGCAKVPYNKSWKDAVVEHYKEKLNLDLILDENPVPISTYVYKQLHLSLGLIVLAEVEDPSVIAIEDENRYSMGKWVEFKDESFFNDPQNLFMDGVKECVLKASTLIKGETFR